MKEIKCPKCGATIAADEADYALIVNQVRTAAFEEDVKGRMAELHKRHQAEQEAANLKTSKAYQEKLTNKDIELANTDAVIK